MGTCTLFGTVRKIGEGRELKGSDLVCPLGAMGLPAIEGAVCGAYGVKSARLLSGLLIEREAIKLFQEDRDIFECRFDVPRGGNDSRLYLDEMLKSPMVNMLRLRSDAKDYIEENWLELFHTQVGKDREEAFPRTPTKRPDMITKLRERALPKAKLIIFPVQIGDEVLAMGVCFSASSVKNIQITA